MSTETENSKEQPEATQNQENTTNTPASAQTTETPVATKPETIATHSSTEPAFLVEETEEDLIPTTLFKDRDGIYSLGRHSLALLCPFRTTRTFTTPSIDPVTRRQREDKQGNKLDNLYPHPVRCDSLCPKFDVKKREGGHNVYLNCGAGMDTYLIPEKNYIEYKKPSAILSPTDADIAAVDPILRNLKLDN